MRHHLILLGLLVGWAAFASDASAGPIIFYTVENGTSSGFSTSGVHSGTRAGGSESYDVAYDGGAAGTATFYKSGSLLLGFPTNGVLKAELITPDTIKLLPSTLTSGTASRAGTLDITGGSLTHTGGFTYGTIEYDLKITSGPGAGIDDSGTFYVYGNHFISGANITNPTVDPYRLTLWANNWRNHLEGPTAVDQRMGLDLKAVGQPVPEPGTLALVAGAIAAGVASRRRRKKA